MYIVKYLFFLLLISLCLIATGQNDTNLYGNDALTADDIVFKRDYTVGLKLHTSGYGLNATFGKIKSIHKRRSLDVGVMSIKHPQEHRQQSLVTLGRVTAKGYVYGKQNSFYNANVGLTWYQNIAEKSPKNGVAVSYFYGLSGSIGLLKPYYLELLYAVDDNNYPLTKHEKYTEENASLFLNEHLIYGSSGMLYGWNELQIVPGVQVKGGMHFDWANLNEFIKAVDVGMMLNVYPKRIPLLIAGEKIKNSFVYPNFYINFMLGKRKYR